MRRHPILIGCTIFALVTFVFVIAISVMIVWGDSDGLSFGKGERIAVVPIEGVLMESREIVENLDKYRKDKKIRAVVIRIDSPGGAVGPSQEIYEAVKRLDKVKPVVASLGSVAASGGYYVAAGARKIVANPGTITGSIGVIIEVTNLEGILEWMKIRREVIKSGEFKDIGSPLREMKKEERQLLQEMIDDVHGQFIDAVVKGRPLEREEVVKLATGLIFSGKQALENGLVDVLGDLYAARKLAAKEAGIDGEFKTVYPPENKPGIMDLIGSANAVIEKLKGFTNIRIMYLWRI